jgi:hypothetical protein
MINETVEKYLYEAKSTKAIENRVKKVNGYIAQAKKDDISAVEPDSTWESVYDFEPIEIKGNFIYFKWAEPYARSSKDKNQKERYNLNNEDHLEDVKYMFNWVTRAIKKGYREEGKTFKP